MGLTLFGLKMAGTGKCLLVTGPPGVGKTTLIMRVFDMIRVFNPNLKIQGFYTREMRERGQRVGFQVVTLDGRTSLLASSTVSSQESMTWPNVGKYKVDIASFESIALPELQVKDDTHLFIIDELGKMEMFSPSFFPAVLKVLGSNIPLLASIPIPKFGRDLPGAVARLKNQPGVTVITLSESNRDSMKEHIFDVFSGWLPKQ
ncbi:uncharacterized protein LOC9302851 isoform X1 [Arabidopsis lyrata subsp. lyrata]|uniref:uncharacterized protein LOC9302851 isoform X1 n=1 Tax=Arabidopsis lyrata subsp. lyrata TaxID=81972 RepID=UPI000A29D2B0|nr:uncharacterized protein LOC9302851 isoform X1 [Arabidopsis lyrata subsp. lyrata]|eukprot:XP_020888321.1 uncharacterized protein LOC9302851 isoform X1 [Arabidopsis lyrata subsp. lyrata]